MRSRLGGILWLVLVLTGSHLEAQFVQYSPPGDFQGPAESKEAAFERAMREARWRFGRLLVDPWVALRNVGYQDSLTEFSADGSPRPEQVSDVTAGLGAGIYTYLPLASDFVWGTFLLPEYVWWQDLSERRRLNGRYGTGLFGNLGRIGVEATLTRFEQPEIFSIEVEEPLNQRSDRAILDLTLDLGKGLLLFARGGASRFSSLEDASIFTALSRLDRDESMYRAGAGFRSKRGLRFGLGVEETEAEFELSEADRSNTGSALVFDLAYDGPLFEVTAELADRSLDPKSDSGFVEFDGETVALGLRARAFGPVWLDLFGRRDLSFSILEGFSHIENESQGAGVSTALGSRARLRLFVEEGEFEFVEIDSAAERRVDDRTSVGAAISFDLGRLSFLLRAVRSDYTSNFPENDREVTRVTSAIGLGGGGSSPWG